ncbi:hypothetical protein GCM10027610_039460 [Dactylosporangium cerinum]
MNGAGPPVLFMVGDDQKDLDALRQALDRRFGADYRIVAETVPARALSVLETLRDRDEHVAAVIAEHRMPKMSGEAFLVRAHRLHPFAGRALIAPVFDRPAEQAIFRGMALGRIDMILVRPWDPADHWLYPRIGVLLDNWVQATEQPGVSAMRIVAEPGAPRTHELLDLLYRNAVPVQSFPPDSPEGRHLLELAGHDGQQVPVCVYFDGRVQADPSVPQIAEAMGFHARPEADHYDMTVIGGGPAGLSAALSSASEGLHTLVLEPLTTGGQAGTTSMIRNYLGFPYGVGGRGLTMLARGQALLFGAELVFDRAVGLDVRDRRQLITLAGGSEVTSDATVLSTGVRYRRLRAPGVEDLLGAGVFYGAALCEAPATRGQPVYIVGAGNSAGQAALHLARYAEQVTIVARGKPCPRPCRPTWSSRSLTSATSPSAPTPTSPVPPAPGGWNSSSCTTRRPAAPNRLPHRPCSSSSAPIHAPTGSPLHSPATRPATCSPDRTSTPTVSHPAAGPRPAARCRWRPASRACSPPATFATDQRNAWQRPSAKAPPPSSSHISTSTSSPTGPDESGGPAELGGSGPERIASTAEPGGRGWSASTSGSVPESHTVSGAQAPLLVGGAGAGPELAFRAIGGGEGAGVQAQPGLDPGDGAVGVDGRSLVLVDHAAEDSSPSNRCVDGDDYIWVVVGRMLIVAGGR